jgi:hypothetical protein
MIDDCILRIRRNFDTCARGASEDRCMPKAMTQHKSGVTARSVTRTVVVPPVSTVHTVRRTAGQVQQLAEVKATERSLPRSNARTISVADWWH